MWYWDGRAWRYSLPPRQDRPGMFWFFGAPEWASQFFLMGLILLIPIVGQMAMLGWYLGVRDNLRAGVWILPRANFDYLERGARVWVVQLLYGLVVWPLYLALVTAIVLTVVVGAPALVVLLLILALVGAVLAANLVLGFLAAAIISVTDRSGVGAALNPARVWRVAQANPAASWRVFGAYLLGSLGAFAVGLVGLVVPFGFVIVYLILPAAFLMAAPAQAEFNETVDAAPQPSGTPQSR